MAGLHGCYSSKLLFLDLEWFLLLQPFFDCIPWSSGVQSVFIWFSSCQSLSLLTDSSTEVVAPFFIDWPLFALEIIRNFVKKVKLVDIAKLIMKHIGLQMLNEHALLAICHALWSRLYILIERETWNYDTTPQRMKFCLIRSYYIQMVLMKTWNHEKDLKDLIMSIISHCHSIYYLQTLLQTSEVSSTR